MHNIRIFVNRILRFLLRHTSRFIRPSKKRLFLSSFSGSFSDSPKQIALKLLEKCPSLHLFYLVFDSCKELPNGITKVVPGTWQEVWYRARSGIIIDNNYGNHAVWMRDPTKDSRKQFMKTLKSIKEKNQLVISTWHGTPLKKMGIDTPNSNIIAFDCPNTIMFLGNGFTAEIMRRLTFNKIQIQCLGTPRNDPLLKEISNHDIEDLKKRLGIPNKMRVVLYAPTFRDSNGEGSEANIDKSGLQQLREISVDKLLSALSSKFGGDFCLVLRFHYFVDKSVDWETIQKDYNGIVINGNKNEDMVDYLKVTDILITDASSCMFDFSLTRRPCFLFFPDVIQYIKERGVYLNFDELPFPLSTDFQTLICSIKDFNEEEYKDHVNTLLANLENVEDGYSAERIVEYIEKNLINN